MNTNRTPHVNLKFLLIRPIKFYFTAFLLVFFLLVMALNWSLYSKAKTIQQEVNLQSKTQSHQEIEATLKDTIDQIQNYLKNLSEWDETHQQISDQSYYFYWHEERLKDNLFFKKDYDELELYNAQKNLLVGRPSISKHRELTLPQTIQSLTPQLIFEDNKETHLTLFQPIYERGSNEVIGYIGLSVDFLPHLLRQSAFQYTNKSSIRLNGTGTVPFSEAMQHLNFTPIQNTVANYLWELIKQFIVQIILLLLVLTVILSILLNQLFNKPIAILSQYLKQLKDRPKDTHIVPPTIFYLREFETLKNSIHDYHRDLLSAQQALDKQNQTVWDQARRDVLTNIYNRRAFDEAWNDVLMNYTIYGVMTSFILFDCDYFKALNDTYGHEVGDEVIRVSATIIQTALPLECPPYRIGGDEFAVIVQNKTAEQTQVIASKCLAALNDYNFSRIGIKEKLSFSVGISSVNPLDSEDIANDIASLPRQADIAMYKAKQSHHNKIQLYHRKLEQEAQSLVSNDVVNTIANAIHTGENIKMHFQPIQSTTTEEVYFESLIRVQIHDQLIFPSDIFSVVQRRRLEVEIDTQVIQKVLKSLESGIIPNETGVAINISGKTLLHPSFVALFDAFTPYIPHYKIVIEITENTLIDHMNYATKVLNELRDQGFLIALDDFGSGYSSIRYLANMPVDIIKFDMSMTQALNSDEKTKNIILSTADMVRRSGYDLVLEGIEDKAMLEKAKQAGATHLQGYLLGKPKPIPTRPKKIQ